ncbi:hypothetical protein E4U19_007350 [Claviceps sp. Clav32 group G5]|nr:hypothetical protein E4U19_007350 [Claviceps sp. Clav32 group G5]
MTEGVDTPAQRNPADFDSQKIRLLRIRCKIQGTGNGNVCVASYKLHCSKLVGQASVSPRGGGLEIKAERQPLYLEAATWSIHVSPKKGEASISSYADNRRYQPPDHCDGSGTTLRQESPK